MGFIINHTIANFQSFLTLTKANVNYTKFDYLHNIDFVISQLHKYRNTVFKDIHKQLIESMIDFFNQYKHKAKGGKIHVKINYFDKVWQDMIGQYLNKHFVGMDLTGENIIFDSAQTKSTIKFSEQSFTDIDDSDHHFYIDIDHVALDCNTLYILDSKYFFEASSLNYKQYAYNEILRYHYPTVNNIHNVLLLPGRNCSKLHFSLGSKYTGSRNFGNKIVEQYIDPKEVMQDYLAKTF